MERYKKIEKRSVPDQIFETLKQSILAGKWPAGASLPSESQLASEFGVSRMSVRTAVKKLETFGFVEVRMGEGSFVVEYDPSVFLKGLGPILSKPKNALEIIEFRKALEVECIKLAFKKADGEDIALLEELFKDYIEAVAAKDSKKAVSYDYRFHRQIFQMSKNSLFIQIYESMAELFFLHIDKNEKLYEETYGTMNPRTDYHGLIVAAMKNSDLTSAVAEYTKMIDQLVAAYKKQNGEGFGS